MKKLSVLALILVLAISVTGCVGGDAKLYNAFNKMQDVNTMESDMEMSFTIKGEGFSEESQAVLDQVAAMVNTSKITMNQKMEQNKDKTVAKVQADTNMNFGGMAMDMNVWVDVDMSKDEPKIKEIIKMPQMLMSSMFPNDTEKQYIVYDIAEMMKSGNEEMNFNELMKFSKEFEPKLTEFVKELQKDFKPGIEIVKAKGNKEVDGEKLEIYELKLDDANLKKFVKYAVNYALDKEATVEFMKVYMDAVAKFMPVPAGEKEEAQAEIKESLKEMEKELPNLKKEFNDFMEEYKDVKILGDKGIVIEYGIDKDGYIAHEAGSIDFRIDLGQIAKIAESAAKATEKDAKVEEKVLPEMKGIINLGIDFTSNSYNFNSKDVKVEMPELNKKNSVSFTELMEMEIEETTKPASESAK